MIVYQPPVTHTWTDLKVVLMSGLSDPSSTALSRSQQQFLDRLPVPRESKLYANFPYLPANRPEQASISLPVASLRNLRQFLNVSKEPYRSHAHGHWNSLVSSCNGLLVITISCGLQILNACLANGIRPHELSVLALGPVAWNRPQATHTLVRGARDCVFNPFFRTVDITIPRAGHLEYLEHPQVYELAATRLSELAERVRLLQVR